MVALVAVVAAYVAARVGWLTLKALPGGLLTLLSAQRGASGEVAPVSGLALALGGSVSAGGAVVVAAALHHGGPGAIFWMWVTALLVAPIKYTQVTLAARHRAASGVAGPTLHLDALGHRGAATIIAALGLLAAFGWGALTQCAVAAEAAESALGVPRIAVGLVLAALATGLALAGTRKVAAAATVLVPLSILLLLVAVGALLFFNFRDIPETFGFVRDGVIRLEAGLGGAVAGVSTVTLAWGVKTAFVTSEMFGPTTPAAFSVARASAPAHLGGLASLLPLVDTVAVATLIGFCAVTTESWDRKAPSVVPASEVVAVPPRLMEMTGQQTEFAWIESGLRALAATDTASAPERVEVDKGDTLDLYFVYEHGLIDTPVLKTASGEPFTGTLEVDLVTGAWTPSDLLVEGLMLQNHIGLLSLGFERGYSKAKQESLQKRGPAVLAVILLLFALTSMLVWAWTGGALAERLAGPAGRPLSLGIFAVAGLGGSMASVPLASGIGQLVLTALGLAYLAVLALVASHVRD